MNEPERAFNTHTHSPAWRPLCRLFELHKDEFTRVHAAQRYQEKFHIGEAMWNWMKEQRYVPVELLAEAEKIHFRPTKEKEGLPLWRLAFKPIRSSKEIDALFEGKRRGPTPEYARLAEAGLVPADPLSVPRPTRSPDQGAPETQSIGRRADRYLARQEWSALPDGAEWLYIYTTTRELELQEQHGIEPVVKIGCSRGSYAARIAQQAGSTAAGTTLVCMYAYRMQDSSRAESSVHHALKLQGRHVKDAPGIEWFKITPEAAHHLVLAIVGGKVAAIGADESLTTAK